MSRIRITIRHSGDGTYRAEDRDGQFLVESAAPLIDAAKALIARGARPDDVLVVQGDTPSTTPVPLAAIVEASTKYRREFHGQRQTFGQ